MKKKNIDPVLGYEFKTTANEIHWPILSTHGRGWKKRKVTVGEIVAMLHRLESAIQRDLTDIAEGTITIPRDGEDEK